MGISILELVLQRLREAGFAADVGYPGQKYPQISSPVAAVHIEKVNRSDLTVTVEVSIVCPAVLGGTCCEVEALRATQVLCAAGASCIQQGCRYDGMAQVYTVSVMATFTCVAEAENCTMGPGFAVYLNDTHMPFAICFQAEQVSQNKAQYAMGEAAPVGISRGSWVWNLRLEEMIPGGSVDSDEAAEPVNVKLVRDGTTEVYHHCLWNNVRREFTREGLRRIRTGVSMLREEVTDE